MDLSLKPPKKSDLDKKWMKKRLDRAIKIQPEYHLIVTEGTDTEPEYFGSIKEVINKKYPEKIKLDVYGEGDNTISLFRKRKLVRKKVQMYTNMFGLSMIRMIFRQIT